jgi:hypothetical protein
MQSPFEVFEKTNLLRPISSINDNNSANKDKVVNEVNISKEVEIKEKKYTRSNTIKNKVLEVFDIYVYII